MLFQNGINFNDLPNWQKRGVGFYWMNYDKKGINPKTGEKKLTQRRKIYVDYDLPMRNEYDGFILEILEKDTKM